MQDDVADELAEPRRSQHQDAPVLPGRLHADCLEPPGDRRAAFVGGKNALTRPFPKQDVPILFFQVQVLMVPCL